MIYFCGEVASLSRPGNQHSWHCDLEYENWDGITIWIGLKNLNKKTELSLITHTHTIDTFPQKLSEKNIDLNNNNEVLYEAKKLILTVN